MIADIIILNSKDRKHIKQQLEEFGVTTLPDKVFFCLNKKERVYTTNREIFDLDFHKLRVNAFGCYFGTYMKDGFRLSLEGLDLVKEQITKNILEVTKELRDEWLKGNDLEHDTSKFEGKYVIIKFNKDLFGVGKAKNGKILNYLPKSRRLKKIFDEKG